MLNFWNLNHYHWLTVLKDLEGLITKEKPFILDLKIFEDANLLSSSIFLPDTYKLNPYGLLDEDELVMCEITDSTRLRFSKLV